MFYYNIPLDLTVNGQKTGNVKWAAETIILPSLSTIILFSEFDILAKKTWVSLIC